MAPEAIDLVTLSHSGFNLRVEMGKKEVVFADLGHKKL